jgi:hypothetical protein
MGGFVDEHDRSRSISCEADNLTHSPVLSSTQGAQGGVADNFDLGLQLRLK